MATLAEIFGTIPTDCYVDDSGVYLNDDRVALSNTRNAAYIRWNGERRLERIGNAIYNVTKPLVFCASAPNVSPSSLLNVCIGALAGGGVIIQRATFDKSIIANEENIDPQELTKFHGVAMVWIQYESTGIEVFNIPSPQVQSPVVAFGIFDLTFDSSFN